MVSAATEVLVVYASRYGSTRGIAERIAAMLWSHGRHVVLRTANELGGPGADVLGAYDAIVIGSPVYDGSWLPPAVEVVSRHLGELVDHPVRLFSVGSFGDTHPVLGALIKREPREIAAVRDAIRPRDYRVFAGAVEPGRWSRIGRLVHRGLGGRWGDNRDWAEIDAWAGSIARALPALAPA